MKIIVVEDEERIREGIHSLIDMMEGDWEFAGEAENGADGLELLRRVKPDAVITDIRMPEMGGLEMIKAARNEGINAKAIVVSAYSEFEYAREALNLGASDYLLKPIAVDEFFATLDRVKTQIEREASKQPDMLGGLEKILAGFIYGQYEVNEEICGYLSSRYHLEKDSSLIVLCIYLGSGSGRHNDTVKKEWEQMLKSAGAEEFCILESEYEKTLPVIIYRYADPVKVKRGIQSFLMSGKESAGNAGFIVSDGLENLRKSYETIYGSMDWNVTLGDGVLITWPHVTQIQTTVCVYPAELENSIKSELCLGNLKNVRTIMKKFSAFFSEGRPYSPRDIKECYIRFLMAAVGMMNELGMIDYSRFNQQAVLDGIMKSRSRRELEEVAGEVLSNLRPGEDEAGKEEHLTVKRMKSMIHEFYQSGITLDEIAHRLNVTPEYLSNQFHRATGETFSVYMRNYRIQKAKELLIGTQMKLYEIAEAVGYSDGKYFSKVFKECTGCLPAEYRKRNK